MQYTILLVDDELNILDSLKRVLGPSRYAITTCQDPLEAIKLLQHEKYHLVISDQRMPGMLGTELLQNVDKLQHQTRRVLMSAHADFAEITAGFNAESIHHFIPKPCENYVFRDVVVAQLKLYETSPQLEAIAPRKKFENYKAPFSGSVNPPLQAFHHILTSDPVMLEQIAFIKKAASFGAPFYINGETGTGKEMFAKAIHLESPRKKEIFLALNCANLSDTLLESQLFGHAKGAFTGAEKSQLGMLAAAERGTLFLDEITEIPLALQAKLLRVLQEKEFTPVGKTSPIPFDVQIISASSLNLNDAVDQGMFRDDLRYRLEVMPITLPPLRERRTDIKALFNYLLKQQFASSNIKHYEISALIYPYIVNYPWPGNIRELINLCTYIAVMAQSNSGNITIDCLPDKIINPNFTIEKPHLAEPKTEHAPITITRVGKNKEFLRMTLDSFANNRTATALHLGISRMTLWRKMKEFELL